jgi:hypothetical protein
MRVNILVINENINKKKIRIEYLIIIINNYIII